MEELIDILKESRDFWVEESKFWREQYCALLEQLKKIRIKDKEV